MTFVKVDGEITFLVNHLAKLELKPEFFANPPVNLSELVRTRSKKVKTKLLSLAENMHPFTRSFLRVMVHKQWVPVAAQVVVASGTARIGTAIDVVVAHASKPHKHILIEIKCGYYRYLKRYSAQLHKPYQELTNCPLYQFMLQLEVGRLLYRRQHRTQKAEECYVVVLHEYGSHCYRLGDKITQHSSELWRILVETASQTKHMRTEAKRMAHDSYKKRKVEEAYAALQHPLPPHRRPPPLPGHITKRLKPPKHGPLSRTVDNQPSLGPVKERDGFGNTIYSVPERSATGYHNAKGEFLWDAFLS